MKRTFMNDHLESRSSQKSENIDMAETPRPANRLFYSLPSRESPTRCTTTKLTTRSRSSSNGDAKSSTSECDTDEYHTKDLLLQYISDNVIGADKTFSGPFGLRKVTYLDYVASGKALDFIEDYIRLHVLPEYGNTHTTTSVTSLQTTLFRHEARDILRNSFNASEHDSVIFTGSGCTGAVHKLIHALNLEQNPTVVLFGPYEHHSNILPWKEAGAETIRLHQTDTGHIDMNHLEVTLKAYQGDPRQVIGAFSAASNVTGVLTDVDAITICLHKHKAMAVWDYACAAPYVKLDMNPYIGGPDQQYVYKDAVVFSVHKFVGGISTPGVLIAKKKLFKHPVPDGCGGGTIFFVRRDHHRYLQEPESREEGGTPAIVESIRAGLVVQLRETVGVETIHRRDQWLLSEAQAAWSNCPELIQLGPGPGPESPDKLPIFSFLVLHRQTGRFLHHNFVATILNDVFGIQARGGCACAGPYAMDLLGLDEHMAEYIENLIAEDSRLDRIHLRRLREYSHREILRPGFVRLNLPYFMTEECLQFVLEAVKMTAEHAWMLLPQYLFNPETAEWRQKHFQTFKDRKWLGHISYQSGHMKYHEPRRNSKGPLPTSYQDCLAKAKKIFADAKKLRLKIPDQSALFDADAGKCRWFCLPSEANACLLQQQGLSATPLPVHASQDELPFFPGRLDKSIAKPNSHQREFSNDSVTTDKALVNNHRVYEISQDSTSKMAVCIDKTQKLDEKIKSAGREGYNSVTNNVSRRESDLETESASNKNAHMSALEDALKYADSLLKTCGTSDTAKAVDDVMNTIWKNFDPNNPQYVHMKESKNVRSHLEEVSGASNHTWNSSSSPGGKNCCSAGNERKINSNGLSNIKKDHVFAIQNAMNEIWEQFTPRRHKEEKVDNTTKVEAVAEFGHEGNKTVCISKTHEDFKNEKVAGVLIAINEIREHFSPKSSAPQEDKSPISCPVTMKPRTDMVADVLNVMNGIREHFTHKQAGQEPLSYSISENFPKPDEVSGVVSAMNEIRKNCTPKFVHDSYIEDKPLPCSVSKDDPKTDKVAESVNAIKDVKELFIHTDSCAGTEGFKLLSKPKHEDEIKNDKLNEISHAMSEIWEHFTTKRETHNIKVDSKTSFSSQEVGDFDSTKKSSKQLVATQPSSFSKGMIQILNQGFEKSAVEEKVNEITDSNSSFPSNEDLISSIQNSFSQLETVNHSNNGSSTGPSTKISSYHSSSTLSGATTACPFVKKSVEPFRKDLKNRNAPQLSVAGAQWFNPPKQIFKAAVTALEEYSMLSNGDKVLVCLSGGKDSLSLLHTLRQYQFYAKGKGILFEFGAVTVDPMTASYDPSPLKQYLASLKVPYFYESQCILETAEKLPYECASICSFCSRMKRGRIYAAARREGFNVLALGQHLDDLTESFLMSFFHNGNLNTMKAHYTVKQGDLRVIRPFVYVREADLRTFAEQHKLPVIAENCPACFEAPKERHRTKQLLAAQEVMFPQVYSSMMAALKPLMARGASTGEED